MGKLFWKWSRKKKHNSNNNYYQKSNTVTPGNNTNVKSNIIGSSQNSTPTPLPGMSGQNFVLRRKNPNFNNKQSNKNDDKKNKKKKKDVFGMIN